MIIRGDQTEQISPAVCVDCQLDVLCERFPVEHVRRLAKLKAHQVVQLNGRTIRRREFRQPECLKNRTFSRAVNSRQQDELAHLESYVFKRLEISDLERTYHHAIASWMNPRVFSNLP